MDIEFKKYEDVINFYDSNKTIQGEYEILINYKEHDYLVSTHSTLFQFQKDAVIKEILYNEKKGKHIIKKEIVDRFHPNNIENNKFWSLAKIKLPLFSVCGSFSKNIEDCNQQTYGMAKNLGFIDFIKGIIKENKEKINFFEIGYGHGNLYNHFKYKVNYLGIDYYKNDNLNKYNNLLLIEKSGIPNDLIEDNLQDIIYSVNVLQHCSQKDRFEYLKQSFDKLKVGGYFIGTCFLETEKNKNMYCWGIEDEFGRKYTHFLNQLTEVDTENELKAYIQSLGYKPIKFNVENLNCLSFILQK
jgi:hypothetical protein